MKLRIAGLASLVFVSTLFGQTTGLTDEQVEAAIAAAKQPGWKSLFVEATGPFLADYSLLLQGPVGRTMDMAREAYESYKPLTTATVPAGVRAHEVTLAIVRHTGRDVPGIKNVVIMPRKRHLAMQRSSRSLRAAGATTSYAVISHKKPFLGRGGPVLGSIPSHFHCSSVLLKMHFRSPIFKSFSSPKPGTSVTRSKPKIATAFDETAFAWYRVTIFMKQRRICHL